MAPRMVCALRCFIFILTLVVWEAATESVARPSGFVRQGRSLTFPYGFGESYLEFTFGVGLPMNLPSPYQVSMSLEIRADYKYPVNASDFTYPTKRREEEEKEKEKEMEKKEMEKGSAVNVTERHRSAEVIQTLRAHGANSGEAKIRDKPERIGNNTDKLNLTGCRDGTDKDFGKLKLIKTEDGTNFTTVTEDNTIKGGCYSKASGVQADKTQAQLNTNKTRANYNKPMPPELTSIGDNITNLLHNVDPHDEIPANKTGNQTKESAGGERGGARVVRKRDAGGRSTRWRIYHVLEMAANSVGMDGRACLLRSICDSAATPLHHRSNELIGELLHVLFSPSTTDDERGRYLDNEYRAAERLGAQVGNNCQLLYPECDVSFLDLITTFDLF